MRRAAPKQRLKVIFWRSLPYKHKAALGKGFPHLDTEAS
jgi:hypothetical protein